MKITLFPRLAWTGIRKNAQLYRPYLFTSTGMVMMFYILFFVSNTQLLNGMSGGTTTQAILRLGSFVIAVFSQIFLFYTSSFLLRRRNREFGLYNVLGMDKRGIARVIVWESLIVSGISLALGLALGIALAKFAELGLMNAMHVATDFTLRVDLPSIVVTLVVYAVIFFLLFLNSLRLVRRSDPLALMRSESAGEKPPRANWLGALLGLLLLGGAYWMAVTIESPLQALALFFVAVLMVIVASYLLMITGSVTLCRFLQKRPGYYYRPRHFVSVSSMVFRMKRNGAGLASICILSTMVLVIISSTTSLFFGAEDSLRARYARDVQLDVWMDERVQLEDENLDAFRAVAAQTCEDAGVAPENLLDYRCATIYGVLIDGKFEVGENARSRVEADESAIVSISILPLSDYNRLTGADLTLGADESYIWCNRMSYELPAVRVGDARALTVRGSVPALELGGMAAAMMNSSITVLVEDLNAYVEPLCEAETETSYPALNLEWHYGFDTSAPDAAQSALCDALSRETSILNAAGKCSYYSAECVADNRADFYMTYGGIFFIGIVLSILFIAAAVLIIYYKQICEGYEDQPRFAILRKVGMTREAIRSSVNSQVLTVFFAPLLLAGVHLGFACPMVWKLLQLFNLFNLPLFITVTVCAYLLFAVFYAIVYRLTSNTYCRLVNAAA